jgi:hypothetical protein
MQFQLQLANESWESVSINNDTNNKFNPFLLTFRNIFEASFPIKYKSLHKQEWLNYTRNKNILWT